MNLSKDISMSKPALRLSWTTPQSDVAVSQYQVEYERQGTSRRAVSIVSSGSSTTTLLQALEAGTAYEVRIRAVSAIGNGEWSIKVSERTYISELSGELEVLA